MFSTLSPSLLPAQVTGGLSVIENNLQQLEAVQQAWDDRWHDIFSGTNGLYLGINQFAAVILVGAFIFFAVGWVKEAMERGIFPAFHHVLWVLAIAVLLFNNGALLGSITLGIRDVINAQTSTVLTVQVGEVSMLEALNDVIVSQQAKAQVQREYADCEAKEGQAQIDCFISAGERAQQKLEEAFQNKGFWGAGAERLKERIQQITQYIRQTYQQSDAVPPSNTPFIDILVGTLLQTSSQALAEQFLKGWQWAFANILELSMLLTGLMGPIAVAGSVIPLQGRPLWAWLTGFFSLGMAKFSYSVIVGLAATVVVAADAQTLDDFGFLLLISILAPALALAIAGGAGMAVFRSVSGGATRIIALGSSTLPFPR